MPTQQTTKQILHRSDQAEPTTQPPGKKFFELPPELRNEIYSLVLSEPHGTSCTVTDGDWQPPLTLTCHQLRAEALPIFYSCTHFQIYVNDSKKGALADVRQARERIRSLGADMIRSLRKVTFKANLDRYPCQQDEFKMELEVCRSGIVHCRIGDPDPGGCEFIDVISCYNAPLVRTIKALVKAHDGKVWNQKTFSKALGGFRKLKARLGGCR
nr:hypothetical protein B0A51_06409 [Rachicladosporium sp. CCFEE 5018]